MRRSPRNFNIFFCTFDKLLCRINRLKKRVTNRLASKQLIENTVVIQNWWQICEKRDLRKPAKYFSYDLYVRLGFWSNSTYVRLGFWILFEFYVRSPWFLVFGFWSNSTSTLAFGYQFSIQKNYWNALGLTFSIQNYCKYIINAFLFAKRKLTRKFLRQTIHEISIFATTFVNN